MCIDILNLGDFIISFDFPISKYGIKSIVESISPT